MGSDVKVFWGNEANYLDTWIKNAPSEFTVDGNISNGANMSPLLNLSSNNYKCEIQDITILPTMGKKSGDLLTIGENPHLDLNCGINADSSNCEAIFFI